MSTITAILEPEEDGTVRLPVPKEMRNQVLRVRAEIEPAVNQPRVRSGLWKELPDGFWMAPDFNAPLEDFREYME